MKIVRVSNYNDESVADVLIAENVPQEYAEAIVEFLNDSKLRLSCYWYRVMADDYKLWRGMEELV